MKEKKVSRDTGYIDGAGRGGGRTASVVTLVFTSLVLLFFIVLSSAIDLPIPVMQPKLENPSVDPGSGLWDQSFNYTVNCNFSNRVDITLEVYNLSLRDWKNEGDKTYNYNNTGEWQRLTWENVKICSGECEGTSSYRFKYNETVLETRTGPRISPPPQMFKNATVTPASGYYNTPFNYSVEINTSEDVVLNIYDISINEWVKKGIGNKTGNRWEWRNITFSKDCEGLASYKFGAGTQESEIYYGPTLKPTIPEGIFKNATVTPHSGYYNTPFTYGVEVNTSEDVLLNIYDISIDEWVDIEKDKGTKTGNIWKWKDISFSKDCVGVASYKFIAGTHESEIYYGPTFIPPAPRRGGGGGGGGSSYKPYIIYDKAIVEPDPVSIRGVRETKSFNYSVVVDKDKTLILEIYNLSSNEWEEKGKGEKSKFGDKWKHEWTVNLTVDKNWEGRTCRYRFYPEGQQKYASQVYYGPEIKIKVSLTDIMREIGVSDKPLEEPEIECEVTPKEEGWFKKFTYTAKIKHPDRANMTFLLFVYKPGSGEWKPVPWRKDRYNPIIRSSDYDEDKSNIATMSWTVEKKDVFDEGDAGERSAFYIWYWDGYNEYNESTEPSKGPDLLVNKEPEFVGVPKLNPVNGSIYTVYEYRFDVNDPENDAVYGFLTIKDPLNEDRFTKTEKGEKGFIRFLVGPEQEIFTEDKLNKTNKETFTSQYQLVYWDEGMDVKGERKTTSWFDGPHVSKIRNEHKVEPVKPESGKYNDEFKYEVGLKSSEKNTFWLELTIYDPSNPERTYTHPETKNVTVDAGTWGYDYWNFNPDVFGPDDFGKTARYTIAWKDKSGIEGIIDGSGPYIERAVPLSSFDRPLVPIMSMVVLPSLVFLLSLLLVRYNLREGLRWGKEKWLKKK